MTMGRIASIWGLLGVTALLLYAIIRLSQVFYAGLFVEWGIHHWLALAISTVFMAYSEGYKGFQKAFSPRLVARAKHLHDNARPLETMLSPVSHSISFASNCKAINPIFTKTKTNCFSNITLRLDIHNSPLS